MTIAALVPTARQRVFDSVGVTEPGAKLWTYASQTTTPLATYSDAALTVANTNPVIADASGTFGAIFLLPQAYSLTLLDADDVLIWQQDDVADPGSLIAGLTQTKLVTTQFNAVTGTTGATLTNLVGLTGFAVQAGAVYTFELNLSGVSTANCGLKIGFKYTTATLAALESVSQGFTASAVACQHTTSTTDQAALFGQTAAVIAVRIVGRITVTTAGTLAIQAAQNAAHADTSSIYIGSWARLTQV
jgi:hypothetical protein